MNLFKSKTSNKGLQLFYIIVTLLLLQSCQITKGARAMFSEKVKSEHFEYKDKTIIFAPLAHFGKKVYYTTLTDSIKTWKNSDYIIYYEGIIFKADEMGVDTATADTLINQFRRMMKGDIPTRDYYSELSDVKILKNHIEHPANEDLGMDSTDVNADVTLRDLVYKYEDLYGPVIVDTCDFNTPIDSTLDCGKNLKKTKLTQ